MHTSVVIPAYNAEGTIESCLNALLAQTPPNGECETIVVDDGSNDKTVSIARKQAGVRLLSEPHRGAAAARNRGIGEASGEIVLFTDADCEPTENWVEEMLCPFRDSRSDVVGAKGVYRTRQRELVARFVQLEYEEKYTRMKSARTIDFVDTYSAAYRRDVLLAQGGFDEGFPSASVEDQELSFRLAEQGCRMVFAPQAIVYHKHVTSVRAYAVRKFKIGYWKVRVHQSHPAKIWQDSHTPFTLKLQVALILASAATLAALPFVAFAWAVLAVLLIMFALSALPLIGFITRRDPVVVWIAPAMILIRAAALSNGLVAGAGREIWRGAAWKRGMDVLGSCLGLIVTSPLMLLIALLIKLDSPGSVFFTQLRAGKDSKPFRIYKFRTMVVGAEQMLDQVIARRGLPPPVFKIPHDPRVTRVGRFLRRFSLDELPQFINVLKGDMSLVGPRPEEMRIVSLYTDWHRDRLKVKPGLTGPVQVNGRGKLSLSERVHLEIAYIAHQNLVSDLWIVALTLPAVIRGNGAY